MKKKKIVISGYYGFGNLGDDAILSAITRALNSEIPDLTMRVISNSDNTYLSKEFDIQCVKRTSVFSLIRELLSCDLFLSGGGGLLQDSSGVATIMYYLGFVKLAKMFGKKVMFYAQGFGPVATSQGAKLVKRFANKADLITVRDEESKDLFREFSVTKPPIIVTADPVIALKGEGGKGVYEKEGLSSKEGIDVAISVRPWESNNNFLQEIAKAADLISEKYKARIIIIPFQKTQDLEICEKLAVLMKIKPHVIKGSYTPEEMIDFIGRMDFLLAMRLHALIFASSSKIPMAGIVYDPKVRIFSEQIGIPYRMLDTLKSEDMIADMDSALSDEEKTKRQLKLNIEPYCAKAILTAKIAAELINRESPVKIAEKYNEKLGAK